MGWTDLSVKRGVENENADWLDNINYIAEHRTVAVLSSNHAIAFLPLIAHSAGCIAK
jgi:hypothetical protein